MDIQSGISFDRFSTGQTMIIFFFSYLPPPPQAFQAGQSRRNFLSGAAQLVRLTRGRNVLITSGAEDMMHLRGPADVANMWGGGDYTVSYHIIHMKNNTWGGGDWFFVFTYDEVMGDAVLQKRLA